MNIVQNPPLFLSLATYWTFLSRFKRKLFESFLRTSPGSFELIISINKSTTHHYYHWLLSYESQVKLNLLMIFLKREFFDLLFDNHLVGGIKKNRQLISAPLASPLHLPINLSLFLWLSSLTFKVDFFLLNMPPPYPRRAHWIDEWMLVFSLTIPRVPFHFLFIFFCCVTMQIIK